MTSFLLLNINAAYCAGNLNATGGETKHYSPLEYPMRTKFVNARMREAQSMGLQALAYSLLAHGTQFTSVAAGTYYNEIGHFRCHSSLSVCRSGPR
jgi:hypothetical protein